MYGVATELVYLGHGDDKRKQRKTYEKMKSDGK